MAELCVNPLSNIRVLNFIESDPTESSRFVSLSSPLSDDKDVVILSDIDLILDQKSFLKNNPDFAMRYLNDLKSRNNNSFSDAISKLSDVDLLDTIKPRYANSVGDIFNWFEYMNYRFTRSRDNLVERFRKSKEVNEPPKDE